MHHEIPNCYAGLPFFDLIQSGVLIFESRKPDLNGVVHELRPQDVHDFFIQRKLASVHKILHGIGSCIHLGVGSKVVHGVICYGYAIFDPATVRLV